jgi:hypothetical protein
VYGETSHHLYVWRIQMLASMLTWRHSLPSAYLCGVDVECFPMHCLNNLWCVVGHLPVPSLQACQHHVRRAAPGRERPNRAKRPHSKIPTGNGQDGPAMRPRHPHAAESGVGKHTARESERVQACASRLGSLVGVCYDCAGL